MPKAKEMKAVSEKGSGESPLCGSFYATFCVAREDRDGSSRYRATKMSVLNG